MLGARGNSSYPISTHLLTAAVLETLQGMSACSTRSSLSAVRSSSFEGSRCIGASALAESNRAGAWEHFKSSGNGRAGHGGSNKTHLLSVVCVLRKRSSFVRWNKLEAAALRKEGRKTPTHNLRILNIQHEHGPKQATFHVTSRASIAMHRCVACSRPRA